MIIKIGSQLELNEVRLYCLKLSSLLTVEYKVLGESITPFNSYCVNSITYKKDYKDIYVL